MHAMQYAITLPADYDMSVIRKRVADKGHLLDHLPGLGLKAYLVRERGEDCPVNQYAPFYLWTETPAMSKFLWEGGGFQGIVADFGRPLVHHWVGAEFARGSAREVPTQATITRTPLAADVNPQGALADARTALPGQAQQDGVHSTALAVDPSRWELVHFTLWTSSSPKPSPATVHYRVLHLSCPNIDQLPPLT
jgi:hypothetical protein